MPHLRLKKKLSTMQTKTEYKIIQAVCEEKK